MVILSEKLEPLYFKNISVRFILSVFLVIPLCLLVVFADHSFLDLRIRLSLPKSPEELFIFSIFFGFPHIVASCFSLFDKEYFQFYRNQVTSEFIYYCLFFIIIYFFAGKNIFEALFSLWTIKHVIGQQFFIAPLFAHFSKTNLKLWRNSALLIGIGLYAFTFPERIHLNINPIFYLVFFTIMTSFFTLITVITSSNNDNLTSKIFIWLNWLSIVSGILFVYLHYPFLTILCLRIIHDLIAYHFYITHDTNRNFNYRHNFIYRLFNFLKMPVFLLLPLLSLLIALRFNFKPLPFRYSFALGLVSIFHYYIDSIFWKKDSIHRSLVKIGPP